MPSDLPLPTIDELVKAGHDSIRGRKEKRADTRTGSMLDCTVGPSGVIFSRIAQRDKDLFSSRYFNTARDADLTDRVQRLWSVERVLDTYGVGTAYLSRPTTAAASGTIWKGTRISVASTSGKRRCVTYIVSADTPFGAAKLDIRVPVRAAVIGSGTAVEAHQGTGDQPRLDDPVFDDTIRVDSLICGEGTDYESPEAYRSRTRQFRKNRRVGYLAKILEVCADAGATKVFPFASNYAGAENDFGINVCYVGDSGYTTPPNLVKKVVIALERARVAGADLLVLPMTTAKLSIRATVSLWDDPSGIDVDSVRSAMQSSVVSHFGGDGSGFSYRLDEIRGAMLDATNEVQDVDVTSPSADVTLMTGTPLAFPPMLTRYTLNPNDIQLTFQGPQ